MKRWRTRLLVGVPVALAMMILGAAAASALSAEESCFTNKLNGARAANGRAQLTTDGSLVSIARRHSQRMADSGTIFHNSNLANEAPSGWKSLGENVGTGPNCDSIHDALMNSPSHRANILDPDFNFVGVGVVITSGGQIYVTEVFMERASQPAPNTPAPTSPKPPVVKKAPAPAPVKRAAPPPPPPPPPPPSPGSSVTGQVLAYADLITKELLPSQQEQEAYTNLVTKQREEKERAKAEGKAAARERGAFSRLAALLGGLLSSAV